MTAETTTKTLGILKLTKVIAGSKEYENENDNDKPDEQSKPTTTTQTIRKRKSQGRTADVNNFSLTSSRAARPNVKAKVKKLSFL